ncbi:MAG TPA: permease-like cell division protein FtsX [Candidatus Paceibacterota bacterium]|nr:permease-like cell division protein FtsX [Candidatus Paceibacterota bacterium]
MFTVISRIVRYGMKNFWRNGWLSAATVAIMLISLMVSMGLMIFNYITDQAVASIQDKIDISVYFKTSAPEDEILNIKSSLENMAQVKNVEYVSSDQALSIFKDKHSNDPTISQAVSELNGNPLEASLNIKAKQPDQYAAIADYFNTPDLTQFVDSVSYAKNQVAIDRLTAIVQNVGWGGFVLTFVMALIAGLVVFNTVRLTIYSNRDEISIMRAVGASNGLVRGPYIVEGIAGGVAAAIISVIISAPIAYSISPYINSFIPGLDVFSYFMSNIFRLTMYQILFAVVIAALSSFIAIRRYLRN